MTVVAYMTAAATRMGQEGQGWRAAAHLLRMVRWYGPPGRVCSTSSRNARAAVAKQGASRHQWLFVHVQGCGCNKMSKKMFF